MSLRRTTVSVHTRSILIGFAILIGSIPTITSASDLSGKRLYCKTVGGTAFTEEHYNHTFVTFISEDKARYTRGLDADLDMFYTTERNQSQIWFGFFDPAEESSLANYGLHVIDRRSLKLTYEMLMGDVKQQCELVSSDEFSNLKQQLLKSHSDEFKL